MPRWSGCSITRPTRSSPASYRTDEARDSSRSVTRHARAVHVADLARCEDAYRAPRRDRRARVARLLALSRRLHPAARGRSADALAALALLAGTARCAHSNRPAARDLERRIHGDPRIARATRRARATWSHAQARHLGVSRARHGRRRADHRWPARVAVRVHRV